MRDAKRKKGGIRAPTPPVRFINAQSTRPLGSKTSHPIQANPEKRSGEKKGPIQLMLNGQASFVQGRGTKKEFNSRLRKGERFKFSNDTGGGTGGEKRSVKTQSKCSDEIGRLQDRGEFSLDKRREGEEKRSRFLYESRPREVQSFE